MGKEKTASVICLGPRDAALVMWDGKDEPRVQLVPARDKESLAGATIAIVLAIYHRCMEDPAELDRILAYMGEKNAAVEGRRSAKVN